MFVKLTGDQVSQYWDEISFSISNSLPPLVGEGPDLLGNILTMLLTDEMQCWASVKVSENGAVNIRALVTTQIVKEPTSQCRDLLIFSVYGYSLLTEEEWKEGYLTLSQWSAARGCGRLVAYTNFSNIAERVKTLGGESRYFVTIPVRR